MSHLRLVPPLPADPAPDPVEVPDDDRVVPLGFFQMASGICLCRECTMKRHPAYGAP